MREKVRQRSRHDCGVACLAMAAGLTYDRASQAFEGAGLTARRGRRKPYSSNFKELQGVLGAVGLTAVRRRYRGWSNVGPSAIVKVGVRPNGDWHWVYVGRDPLMGLYLNDPNSDLPTFEITPVDVMCIHLPSYQPAGCYLEILPQEN